MKIQRSSLPPPKRIIIGYMVALTCCSTGLGRRYVSDELAAAGACAVLVRLGAGHPAGQHPVLSGGLMARASRPIGPVASGRCPGGPPVPRPTPRDLDFELAPHGEVARSVQVEDEHDAAMLVDLCLGLADPGARPGELSRRRLDARRTPRERFHRRRRIGCRGSDRCLGPSHMTVLELVLVALSVPTSNQPQAEAIADATELALPVRPARPAGRAARDHADARPGAGRLRARISRLARPDRGTGSGARPVFRARRADGAGDLGGMRPRRHGAVDHRKSCDAGHAVRPS